MVFSWQINNYDQILKLENEYCLLKCKITFKNTMDMYRTYLCVDTYVSVNKHCVGSLDWSTSQNVKVLQTISLGVNCCINVMFAGNSKGCSTKDVE